MRWDDYLQNNVEFRLVYTLCNAVTSGHLHALGGKVNGDECRNQWDESTANVAEQIAQFQDP